MIKGTAVLYYDDNTRLDVPFGEDLSNIKKNGHPPSNYSLILETQSIHMNNVTDLIKFVEWVALMVRIIGGNEDARVWRNKSISTVGRPKSRDNTELEGGAS